MKELQKLLKAAKEDNNESRERRAQIIVMASRLMGCRMRDNGP